MISLDELRTHSSERLARSKSLACMFDFCSAGQSDLPANQLVLVHFAVVCI